MVIVTTDREKALHEIKRFSMYPVTFCRSSDLEHELRVLRLFDYAIPAVMNAFEGFDYHLARAVIRVHDDHEIIKGDTQLGHKLKMSQAELALDHQQDLVAIDEVVRLYGPPSSPYNYRDLLLTAVNKDTLVGQVASFFDKLDGYCESMHELQIGNLYYVDPLMNYAKILSEFSMHYPLTAPLFKGNHPLLVPPVEITRDEAKNIAQNGTPYTLATLNRITEFPQYNCWKKLVMDLDAWMLI